MMHNTNKLIHGVIETIAPYQIHYIHVWRSHRIDKITFERFFNATKSLISKFISKHIKIIPSLAA